VVLGSGWVAGQGPVELAAGADGGLGDDLAQSGTGTVRADEQPGAGPRVRQAVSGQPISPFILDAKFPITAPMYWSNVWAGGVIIVLAVGALALGRPAER
jgi:hypothetical protein